MKQASFTAVLEREGSAFIALCPELDVASQGDTIESAMTKLGIFSGTEFCRF